MDLAPFADSDGILTVDVELTKECDVFLVDESNYANYHAGRSFRGCGGHYTYSHITIMVSGVGRWYLVVRGDTNYQYKFY